MSTHRVDRVAAQLQTEISEILRGLGDPRIGLISVVEVAVSPDLRSARIRVSTLGGDLEHAALMRVLEHARGFVRRRLATRMRNLRRLPELQFVDDRSMEYAVHIDEVLKEINQEPGMRQGDAG